jgi:hypothetical protein
MPISMFHDGRSGYRFNWPERRLKMRSLYTSDPNEATKRLKELEGGMRADEFKRKYAATKPTNGATNSFADRMAKYRSDPAVTEAVGTTANATLEEVLSKVSQQRLGDTVVDDTPPATVAEPPPTEVVEDANAEWDSGEPEKVPRKRNWKGLGRKLANTIAQADMTIVALGVKAFGTNKKYVMHVGRPSDDAVSITAEGFEMWMDEALDKHPPKPIHLIVGGNILMLLTMIAASERITREEDDARKAAPQPEGTVPS